MELKQSTIPEIAEAELRLVLGAPERYGAYYDHAHGATILLSRLVKSADAVHEIFVRFHALTKKHHTLALLSTVRLHKVQALMDLRQALEAGACAAFAAANPDQAHFVDVTDGGLLEPSQKLASKRYQWLDEHFAAGSKQIKRLKDLINQSGAHANLISTDHGFTMSPAGNWAAAPFFDIEDEHFVKTDLWLLGSTAIAIADLVYGVAQNAPDILFADGFDAEFRCLAEQNGALRAEIMETERFQRAMRKPG